MDSNEESQSERKPFRPPNYSRASRPQDNSPSNAAVPLQLQNWQVHEIDGEATLGPGAAVVPQDTDEPDDRRIAEAVDEFVVATACERHIEIVAGETALLRVKLLNNGYRNAVFDLDVEGWVSEEWFSDLPLHVPLGPGEESETAIPISVPRLPTSHAGDHGLAVVARSSAYPGHVCRTSATLTIARFNDLRLQTMEPLRLRQTWFGKTPTTVASLANWGNYPACCQILGVDRERQCDYVFHLAGRDVPEAGLVQVTLDPGEAINFGVQVRARIQPIFGLMARAHLIRICAQIVGERRTRRSLRGELASQALIGPWQAAAAAGLTVAMIVGVLVAGFALLFALRSPAAEPVTGTTAPEAPVVAFVIHMDQAVPTRQMSVKDPSAEDALGLGPKAPADSEPVVQQPLGGGIPPGSVPVVSPDQVTAPGELPPRRQEAPAPTIAVVAPAASNQPARTEMTYGQMFKQVAQEYDLDWRIVASQAYIESGFDTLALGSYGDLGLMQIRPSTWQEWAPVVGKTDPFDSYDNTVVAAVYLDHLRTVLAQRGYPQQEWMLVAYNWGPDKLLDFLEGGGTFEALPAEIRNYAVDVIRIAQSIPLD